MLHFCWRHCTHNLYKSPALVPHNFHAKLTTMESLLICNWLGKEMKASCKPKGCRGVSADNNLMKIAGSFSIFFSPFHFALFKKN